MYMHELRPASGQVYVYDEEYGGVHVLTSVGAVFDHFNIEDLSNIAVASGSLFTNRWRLATEAEVLAHNWNQGRVFELRATMPDEDPNPGHGVH